LNKLRDLVTFIFDLKLGCHSGDQHLCQVWTGYDLPFQS